jgi:hypothetical protein
MITLKYGGFMKISIFLNKILNLPFIAILYLNNQIPRQIEYIYIFIHQHSLLRLLTLESKIK